MPTTDDALQKQVEKNAKLRQQIADARTTRVEAEQDAANDIHMAQLLTEEAQLTNELADAKRSATKASVAAGVEIPLAAVAEQMEAAVAAQNAEAAGLGEPNNEPVKPDDKSGKES